MRDKCFRGLPHRLPLRAAPLADGDDDETQFLAVRFMPREPLPSEEQDRQREIDVAVRRLTHPIDRGSRFQRFLDGLDWGGSAERTSGVVDNQTARFTPSPELLHASTPPPAQARDPRPAQDPATPTTRPQRATQRSSSRPAAVISTPAPRVSSDVGSRFYFWVALVLVGLSAVLLSTGRTSASRTHPVSSYTR